MAAQAEGAVARVAAEALAVEEAALRAQPLHHVHPLAAEMAGVAASEASGRLPARHTLEEEEEEEEEESEVTPELREDALSCTLEREVSMMSKRQLQ